jgi:DNA-binding XRE family transcriptional regulator
MKTIRVPENLVDCAALAMREWRKKAKVNQAEAAALLGCSQATYSRVERGQSSLPLESLARLSKQDSEYVLGRVRHHAWAAKLIQGAS